MDWCKCMEVRSFKNGIADLFSRELVDGKLRGEFWELFEVKNFNEFRDELSDISWGIGRILGGFLNKPYVRIPGDKMHYQKVADRMAAYQCTRSKRFLVEGHCPSVD